MLSPPAGRAFFPGGDCNWALGSSQAHVVLLVLLIKTIIDHVHVGCDDFDVVVGGNDDDDDEEEEDHLHGSLEESFTRLTGENAVVEPGDFVSTHLRQKILLNSLINPYHHSDQSN